jgi:hypothetical protein
MGESEGIKTDRKALQFRLWHLLALMALVAIWLSVYRLGEPISSLWIATCAFAIGPTLFFAGNTNGNAAVQTCGVLLTLGSPLIAMILVALHWTLTQGGP